MKRQQEVLGSGKIDRGRACEHEHIMPRAVLVLRLGIARMRAPAAQNMNDADFARAIAALRRGAAYTIQPAFSGRWEEVIVNCGGRAAVSLRLPLSRPELDQIIIGVPNYIWSVFHVRMSRYGFRCRCCRRFMRSRTRAAWLPAEATAGMTLAEVLALDGGDRDSLASRARWCLPCAADLAGLAEAAAVAARFSPRRLTVDVAAPD